MVGNHNAVMLISASKSHEMPLQLDAVKKCFTGMMTTHRDDVKKELSKLVDRVKHMGKFNMSRVWSLGFTTRSDTNQAVQS